MTIETRLEQVQAEYLDRMTRGHGSLLLAVERHIAAHHGKMLRPRMLLLAAATLGDEALRSRRTLLLATAVEMLHNASLLHDDVVDHADARRGLPSANARWGNQAAVLVGDFLLAQVMQLLNELDDSAAARRINDTVAAMVEGELLALELGGAPPSQEDYLAIIDCKTARLFATAAALGNPAYEEFGLHYGRLFQLRDDVDDHEDTPFTSALIAREEASLAAIKHTLPIPIK